MQIWTWRAIITVYYGISASMDTEDPGHLTAGSGRLNLLGFGGEAVYTSVALEKENGPRLAVRLVYQKGRHTPSAFTSCASMEKGRKSVFAPGFTSYKTHLQYQT